MLALLLTTAALAATPDYPVTVYGGLGGGLGPSVSRGGHTHGDAADPTATGTVDDGAEGAGHGLSGGGWGVARLAVHHRRVALDLGLRQGFVAGDLREVGAISAGLRWSPGLPYLRAGFMHHHETPWEVVKDDPLLAAIGSAEGIRHRSGGELAIGLAGALNPVELPERRMRAFVELSAIAFPDDKGPQLYGTLDLGFGYSLGRDRSGG